MTLKVLRYTDNMHHDCYETLSNTLIHRHGIEPLPQQHSGLNMKGAQLKKNAPYLYQLIMTSRY